MAEVCKKQTSVFYTIEPLGEKFYSGGFLFAKNYKNFVKTVVKRQLVSLGIMEGYFFAWRIFWKYCCRTVNFTIFVSLLYMGEKFFYTPRTFGISCPWLSDENFFRKNLVKYPNKCVVTFQYKYVDFYFFLEIPRKTILKCPFIVEINFLREKNLCKPSTFLSEVSNYSRRLFEKSLAKHPRKLDVTFQYIWETL